MTTTTLILVVLIGLLLWTIMIYNNLVKLKNQVQEGYSGIDVQLKRRHNLIPNLIETVKGYASHEKGIFEEVTKLRAKIGQAKNQQETNQLESALSLGLGKLIAVAENYPDLKANENFIHLQKELSDIEDQIQLARRYYNGTTRNYNTLIESFPQIIIARFFQFNTFEYFEIEQAEQRQVPKVDFR